MKLFSSTEDISYMLKRVILFEHLLNNYYSDNQAVHMCTAGYFCYCFDHIHLPHRSVIYVYGWKICDAYLKTSLNYDSYPKTLLTSQTLEATSD